MGEGLDKDVLLMPFISTTSIACGFHAGDEDVMKKTVELALLHSVAIGAHPGFADKENFGRRELNLEKEKVEELIFVQLNALKKVTVAFNTTLHHVKPHGALYNMAARDPRLAGIIAKTVKAFDSKLALYGLSGSCSISAAEEEGLKTASEVFADRTYQDDGSLTPRSQPHAMIENDKQSLEQVLQMVAQKTVTSLNGHTVNIVAQTICIHGDGKHAVAFTQSISQMLKQQGIEIKAI